MPGLGQYSIIDVMNAKFVARQVNSRRKPNFTRITTRWESLRYQFFFVSPASCINLKVSSATCFSNLSGRIYMLFFPKTSSSETNWRCSFSTFNSWYVIRRPRLKCGHSEKARLSFRPTVVILAKRLCAISYKDDYHKR